MELEEKFEMKGKMRTFLVFPFFRRDDNDVAKELDNGPFLEVLTT